MGIKEIITSNLRYYKIPVVDVTDDMIDRSIYSSVIYLKKTDDGVYGCLPFEIKNIPVSMLTYTEMNRSEWESEYSSGWEL